MLNKAARANDVSELIRGRAPGSETLEPAMAVSKQKGNTDISDLREGKGPVQILLISEDQQRSSCQSLLRRGSISNRSIQKSKVEVTYILLKQTSQLFFAVLYPQPV